MAKQKDPARNRAYEIWEESGRKKDAPTIGKEVGKPASTVRAWKTKDKWEQIPIPEKPPAPPKRKRGGTFGNKGGKGPPKGSVNAATTGAYMKIHESTLTDEEKELMRSTIDPNLERCKSLVNQLAMQKVRELRMLREIDAIRNGAEMLIRRSFDESTPDGVDSNGQIRTKIVKISREREARRIQLLQWENALTRLQAEIRRTEQAIDSMNSRVGEDEDNAADELERYFRERGQNKDSSIL